MDFWSFLDENFASIMVPIGTISGAFLGAFISSKTQKNVISKQIEWDKVKMRNLQVNETMEVYNKVIEMDGSIYVIEHRHRLGIELGGYTKKVRPLLYEKFHQLHQNIADKVTRMDDIIEMCNFEEEISDENSEILAQIYMDIIEGIKRHLEEYRATYIK
ncbi:hypothetical protein [Lysinibacillus fusiformis]|uniref:hypothetical protein n=1 Tax=Lysinibacillus fusiformis TaxID=28031 RepID=UPI0020BD6ADF|nr:hypothetical protein [Lysinibacillus fusiformis]